MASKLTCPHQPASRWSHAWYGTIHEDEPSVLPTELDTTSHPRHLAVEMDKLTVRYIGRGNHSHDVGAVRTNSPCPPRSLLYYYEVTVVDAGLRGSIAVGLTDETCAPFLASGRDTGRVCLEAHQCLSTLGS